MKISAIVNTRNEEALLADCLESLSWVDEIVVVDMESVDRCKDIAFKYTKHVYNHKPINFVEPARNFAIGKTTGDWIMILDPDERVPQSLAAKLIEIAEENKTNFVRIPRQNLIFNDWIEHSRWWPDYNIRFFKRGRVEWQNEIHSIPITHGEGVNLDAKAEYAIIHNHYSSIDQYLSRMNRYTDVQSKELIDGGYEFDWLDLFHKPLGEFISRFFAASGYKDGLHGLALATLQALSEFVVYLKVWQAQGFQKVSTKIFLKKFFIALNSKAKEFKYWILTLKLQETTKKLPRFWLKIRRKLLI